MSSERRPGNGVATWLIFGVGFLALPAGCAKLSDPVEKEAYRGASRPAPSTNRSGLVSPAPTPEELSAHRPKPADAGTPSEADELESKDTVPAPVSTKKGPSEAQKQIWADSAAKQKARARRGYIHQLGPLAEQAELARKQAAAEAEWQAKIDAEEEAAPRSSGGSPRSSGGSSRSSGGRKTVHVDGYYRKNGTHVNSYMRRPPRSR